MISAVIITLNEEKNIARAIKSLKNLADEIIVVDSGSTDKTKKIAKDFGARIFTHRFANFSSQRNWAVSKTKGEWVLSLDADEQIPESLAAEIKTAIKNTEYVAFLIPRRNFILGKEIKHSRWSPDLHIWLWKKDSGKWAGDVHEEVKILGRVGKLTNAKIHVQQRTMKDFISSNNFYSSLLSKDMYKRGVKFSFWRMFYDSLFEFLVRYIYKWGFLDGLRGFILAYLMVIYKISLWIKIYELQYKTSSRE